jgi:hypothetical protein
MDKLELDARVARLERRLSTLIAVLAVAALAAAVAALAMVSRTAAVRTEDIPATPVPPPAVASTPAKRPAEPENGMGQLQAELRTLRDLQGQGIITLVDFQAKKATILARPLHVGDYAADVRAATKLGALDRAGAMADPVVAAARETAVLPTRRWTCEELEGDRREAERRLAEDDIAGWRETIGRAMTNRPDDTVARRGGDERKAVRAMCRFHLEWTGRMLRDFEARPESLATEVQALRIGDLYCVANAAELFSPFAPDVRRRAGVAAPASPR